MIDKLNNFLNNETHTIKALLAGFLLLLIVLIPFYPLLKDLLRGNWYYFYLSFLFVWFIIWSYIKWKLPKNKKNKVGLCFLIYNESKKEEFQFKRDFISSLKKKLDENNLLGLVTVMEVRNHFSKKIQEINTEEEKIKTIKNWNKKMKAHFLVWGDVRRRMDEGGRIFLQLDSMVYHAPMPLIIKEEFKREMLSVFPREISFLQKAEFKGFQASAKLISIVTQYIVGLAALYSGDPFLALELHFNLLYVSKKIEIITPSRDLIHIKEKTKKIISAEFASICHYYYIKKDLERMFKFAKKALEFEKENYRAYLLLAIYHFLRNRNIKEAFETLEIARKFAEGDLGWLYSKSFLHCYTGDLNKANGCYSKAFRGQLLESEKFLNDIISFIEKILKQEPDKIQLHFALGKIYFQKLNNLPMALENYQKFLASENPGFAKKRELVKDHVKKIEDAMTHGF